MAKKRKIKPKKFESTVPVEPRAPEITEQPTVVKAERMLYRCIAENQFCNKTLEIGGGFGPGQIVDLCELMKDGSELRTHVRLKCFTPIRAGGE